MRLLAWLLCVVYSTIPSFWLLVHPRADYWRSRRASPYKLLLPLWIAMWIAVAAITAPWHRFALYENKWMWLPAAFFFTAGLTLYKLSGDGFSLAQLSGLPEIVRGHRQHKLATTGIRARIRHPIYLAHLCEMLAWSLGSALAVCWLLTAFAIASGAIMIMMEDRELEKRFGGDYLDYRKAVPAVLPKFRS